MSDRDIVERLRDWGHHDWFFVTTDLLSENQDVRFEAADEIERLRAAMSRSPQERQTP